MEYRSEGPEAIVMSGFGENSGWLLNLEASPSAEVVIGTQRFPVVHRFLGEEEAMRVVADYERKNWFMLLIIHSVLTRLLGWKYSESDADRRRLVRQLPLLAFRPRPAAQ
jgi:hypothetical protein